MINGRSQLGVEQVVDGDAYVHTYVPHQRANVHIDSVANRKINGKYRSGFFFFSRKTETRIQSSQTRTFKASHDRIRYTGGFACNGQLLNNAMHWWNLVGINDSEFRNALMSRGAEAWNGMRPDQPDFNALTTILEARDIPGLLRQSVKAVRDTVLREAGGRRLSRAAEYHLAVQFGWKPLLKDVRDFYGAQRGREKKVKWLIANESRLIRKSLELVDVDRSSEDRTVTENYRWGWNPEMSPIMVSQFYGSEKASTTSSLKCTARTWAEGGFRYYLPPGPRDVAWNRKMVRRIMGLRATPSQVYKAMPWTWLGDWFTSVGQFVEAVSPGVADRLYCEYAYIMRTFEDVVTTSAVQYVCVGTMKGANGETVVLTTPVASTRETKYSLKMRCFATPFGFGLKRSDLSPMQLSILAALPLSRQRTL